MNRFGNNFRITIYGESHSEGLGIVIDGVSPGLNLSVDDFKSSLKRRSAGALGTTKRVEEDIPNITSGLYLEKTTGAPINIFFKNKDTNSKTYSNFREHPRPGHGDFALSQKFHNYNDLRGGGAASGRLTLLLVSGGVVAEKVIDKKLKNKVLVSSKILKLGKIENQYNNTEEFLSSEEVINELIYTEKNGDSLGGVIQCKVSNLPVGVGEPFFDSLESVISHLAFSVPGVKGIEFGSGFAGVEKYGSEFNDPFIEKSGKTLTNNNGGINSGVSNGNEISFNVAIKPTSTIFKNQNTFNFKSESIEELKITGRHDVAFIVRTPVIIESIALIGIAELLGGFYEK